LPTLKFEGGSSGFIIYWGTRVPAAINHMEADGSGDYPNIQEAIDACDDGDTIEMGDGLYTGLLNRDMWEDNKIVNFTSASGNPEACIIDCQGSAADPCCIISISVSGEKTRDDFQVTMRDISFRNAWGESGAVQIWDWASVLFENWIFRNNRAEDGSALSIITSVDCLVENSIMAFGEGGHRCTAAPVPSPS
jgi:hypothetical protein